jgi:hypothetical protein
MNRLLIFIPLLLIGCNKTTETPKAAPKASTPTPPATTQAAPTPAPPSSTSSAPPTVAAHVVRGRDLAATRGMFQQMGRMHQQYVVENGPPRRMEDFAENIKRDYADLYRALMERRFVMTLKQNPTSSDVIVCYEKDKDLNGNRVTLFGDGRVELLDEAKWKAALRN